MSYVPTFLATIKNGKLKVEKVAEWQKWLKSLIGKRLEIIIRPRKSKRSLEQLGLYWAWLKLLEDESGQSKNDYHDYFKKKILMREVNLTGEPEKVVSSTSELKTDEFTEYLFKVQERALRDFDAVLPNPYEEEWKLDKIKKGKVHTWRDRMLALEKREREERIAKAQDEDPEYEIDNFLDKLKDESQASPQIQTVERQKNISRQGIYQDRGNFNAV